MELRYKALPIDQLIDIPTRLNTERASLVADLLGDALNHMAADGWKSCSTHKGTAGTIFIFERTDPK